MSNKKDENLVAAVVDQMAEKIIDDAAISVTADMTDFIKSRIARDFPKSLDAVVDVFFNQEVAPELMAFLQSHKDEIIQKCKDRIVDFAVNKILSEISRAIEEARLALDLDD